MTQVKKAIKESNKMADLEILKSQYKAKAKQVKDWLEVEAYGYKRKKILGMFVIMTLVIIAIS